MNNSSYASYENGTRHGCWRRAERKPWSIVEMGAVLGGFVVFWPLGLAALFLKHRNGELWKGASDMQAPWTNWKNPRDAAESFTNGWKKPNWGTQGFSATGNHAFDEYRKTKLEELEALRRKLDEERAAFDEFLNKLRKAKDAEAFEKFMAEKNTPSKTQD